MAPSGRAKRSKASKRCSGATAGVNSYMETGTRAGARWRRGCSRCWTSTTCGTGRASSAGADRVLQRRQAEDRAPDGPAAATVVPRQPAGRAEIARRCVSTRSALALLRRRQAGVRRRCARALPGCAPLHGQQQRATFPDARPQYRRDVHELPGPVNALSARGAPIGLPAARPPRRDAALPWAGGRRGGGVGGAVPATLVAHPRRPGVVRPFAPGVAKTTRHPRPRPSSPPRPSLADRLRPGPPDERRILGCRRRFLRSRSESHPGRAQVRTRRSTITFKQPIGAGDATAHRRLLEDAHLHALDDQPLGLAAGERLRRGASRPVSSSSRFVPPGPSAGRW